MMNNYKSHNKQKGFFDFGLGLGILAVIGVATVLLKPDDTNIKQEKVAYCLDENKTSNRYNHICTDT